MNGHAYHPEPPTMDARAGDRNAPAHEVQGQNTVAVIQPVAAAGSGTAAFFDIGQIHLTEYAHAYGYRHLYTGNYRHGRYGFEVAPVRRADGSINRRMTLDALEQNLGAHESNARVWRLAIAAGLMLLTAAALLASLLWPAPTQAAGARDQAQAIAAATVAEPNLLARCQPAYTLPPGGTDWQVCYSPGALDGAKPRTAVASGNPWVQISVVEQGTLPNYVLVSLHNLHPRRSSSGVATLELWNP